MFILTHHPDDAPPTADTTFLNCDVADAVRIALTAAKGKNLEILSADIGRQLLEHGLIDEIDDAVMLATHAEDHRIEYNQTRPYEAIARNRSKEVHPGRRQPHLSNQTNPANSLTRDNCSESVRGLDVEVLW